MFIFSSLSNNSYTSISLDWFLQTDFVSLFGLWIFFFFFLRAPWHFVLVSAYLKYKPTLPTLSTDVTQKKSSTSKPPFRLWGLFKPSLCVCLPWTCMCIFLMTKISSFFFQESIISCYLWYLSAVSWVGQNSSLPPGSFCYCLQQPPDHLEYAGVH